MIIPTFHVYLYIILHTYASLNSIDYYVACFKSLYDCHHKVYILLQLVFFLFFFSQYFILGDSTLDICGSGSFSLQFTISLWVCTLFKTFLLIFKWFIFFEYKYCYYNGTYIYLHMMWDISKIYCKEGSCRIKWYLHFKYLLTIANFFCRMLYQYAY